MGCGEKKKKEESLHTVLGKGLQSSGHTVSLLYCNDHHWSQSPDTYCLFPCVTVNLHCQLDWI